MAKSRSSHVSGQPVGSDAGPASKFIYQLPDITISKPEMDLLYAAYHQDWVAGTPPEDPQDLERSKKEFLSLRNEAKDPAKEEAAMAEAGSEEQAEQTAALMQDRPYSENLHVANRVFEAQILRDLKQGIGVTLQGPLAWGKSWWRCRFASLLRQEAGWRVFETDLASEVATHLQDIKSVVQRIAQEMYEQLDIEPSQPGQSRQEEPITNVHAFFSTLKEWHKQPQHRAANVLWALDGFDRTLSRSVRDDLLRVVRYSIRQTPWLRMLTCTTEPTMRAKQGASTGWIGPVRPVPKFSKEDVISLGTRFGVEDKPLLETLWKLVDGHPYLIRTGLYELRLRKESERARLLKQASAKQNGGPMFERHLSSLRNRISQKHYALLKEVYEQSISEGENLEQEALLSELESFGIIAYRENRGNPDKETKASFVLSCPLYLQLVRAG